MEKITVTELRSRIYKVTQEVQRTGESIIVTEHGEPVWKIVPVKKRASSKALQANAVKVKSKKQETIWEKWERLGPRDIGVDFERFRWDEKAWEKKWDKILGISPRKGSGKGKRS